jgi:non-ribosomal peptide synthetase component F
LSIERVVEAAAPEREPGRDPLFQVMFTLQAHDSPPLALAGLECRPVRIRNTAAKADLSLLVYVDGDGLAGELEYSTDILSATTVERMAGHFRTLLDEIAKDPDRPISRLPLIAEAERRKIVVDWNRTTTDFPRSRSITSLFDAQVARAPNAVAVIDGSRSLTYAALAVARGALRASSPSAVSRGRASSVSASSARWRRSSRSSACSTRAAHTFRSTSRTRPSACRQCSRMRAPPPS